MKTIISYLCVAALFIATPAVAQPSPEETELRLAQEAFGKGDYTNALRHYEKAFAINSSAANSIRVFISSCYAEELPTSLTRLDSWLQKKRVDAQKLSDQDPSWQSLDAAMRAANGAASRQQQRIADLTDTVKKKDTEIAELQKELSDQRVIIKTIKSDYTRDLDQLKEQYDAQEKDLRHTIDSLRNQHASKGIDE